MQTPRLAPESLEALRGAIITPTSITPGLQPRWVWAQLHAACVLFGGGGRWDRDTGAWLFTRDPRPELAVFLRTQEREVSHA